MEISYGLVNLMYFMLCDELNRIKGSRSNKRRKLLTCFANSLFKVYNNLSLRERPDPRYITKILYTSVADPGFPIGGVPTNWGGADLWHVHFLVKMYAKTKEMDPVGGGGGTHWRYPPGSTNVFQSCFISTMIINFEFHYIDWCMEIRIDIYLCRWILEIMDHR